MEQPPPPVQMVQLLAGFQVSQALYAAAKLGLPDQLAQSPRPIADVAQTLGVDADSLERLARILTGLGVLHHDTEQTYALTALGRTLTSDDPGSMRDLALMWMETHYAPFAGLTDAVRTGHNAAETHYGQPFFTWLGDHPEQVARFTGAMANLTTGIKHGALASCDFSRSRHLVDVGGADGSVLAQVLQRVPEATGVSYDLPHVVPAVESVAKAAGLEERLTGQGGDFFESVPTGADTYLASMVLHDWDDAHARRLLANIAEAAPSGARVYALELVMPESDDPHMAKMIDLTMLGMLDGRERTEPEMQALFEGAGLVFEGVSPTPTPLSIVQARLP
jgi:hypothetical protein